MKYMRLMNDVSKDKGQRQLIWLELLLQAIKESQVECNTRRKITDTRKSKKKGKESTSIKIEMNILGILLGIIALTHVTSSVPVDTEENEGTEK